MIAAYLLPLLLSVTAVGDSLAQSRKGAPLDATPALDNYIVGRYRGAQLLLDTVGTRLQPSLGGTSGARIESIRDPRGDSLIGIHFSPEALAPAFQLNSLVKFAVSSGMMTNTTGKVVARRMFRAPRVPGAGSANDSSWRYGWAYLVVLPRQREQLPALAPRGWFMLDGSAIDPRPTRRNRP